MVWNVHLLPGPPFHFIWKQQVRVTLSVSFSNCLWIFWFKVTNKIRVIMCFICKKKHSLRLIEHTFCKKFSNLFKSMVILLKCITKLEGLKTCPLARPLSGMYPSVKQFQSSCKMQFLLTNKNFVPTTKFLIWQEGNPKILDCGYQGPPSINVTFVLNIK